MTDDCLDDEPTVRDARSRWGRVKFGGRRLPALWSAAPVGLVVAFGVALLFGTTSGVDAPPLVVTAVVAVTITWPCVGLVWALIVDRDTIRGAVADPEQSVEAAWYERAASGAFSDVLLTTGLGTAALAFSGIEVSALIALSAVILVAAGSVGVRYLLQQRRA